MGTRSIQKTIDAEQLDCDLCGATHESRDTAMVLEWEKSPRTVTEDPVTKRPIVTDAVMGDPLVFCRAPVPGSDGTCVKRVAKKLRSMALAVRQGW